MGWDDIRSFLFRLAAVAVVTSIGFLFGNALTSDFGLDGLVGKCLLASVPSFFGFAAFACSALAFRLADFREVSGQVRKLSGWRLRRPLGRSALAPKLD
jgi:hypothetical protein